MTIRKPPGAAKRVEGSLTEALGKLTGDKEGEAKGAAKKREGEAEEAASTRKKPLRRKTLPPEGASLNGSFLPFLKSSLGSSHA